MDNPVICAVLKKDGSPCTYSAKEMVDGVAVCGVHKGRVVAQNLAAEINLASVVEPPISNQEGTMSIYHYLLGRDDESYIDAPRIITNIPSDAVKHAYGLSANLSGRPVALLKDGVETATRIMALDAGTYHFALLERAARNGVKFKVAVMSHKYLAFKGEDYLAATMSKANFAWANADRAFFVMFEGVMTWGLEPLGIEVRNGKKLQKRLAEVVRQTAHSYEGAFTYREFTTPEGDDDIFYDGGNAISARFARKLGFKGVRGNGRGLFELGELKGDWLVVPGLDVDVLYHTENLKPELRTTGWSLFTIENHEPHHMMKHDAQSVGNFSFFLSEDVVRGDLIAMVNNYKASIAEGGDLYNYLADASQSYDEPIQFNLDMVQMSDTLEAQAEMLASVGIAPAMFSNITYTRVEALARKMQATKMHPDELKYMKGMDVYRKMFIPARNAFVGAVSTWEFCTKVCGMDFPGEDGTRTFFNTRVGLVIPGARFRDAAGLHGGHDGDDTHCMYAIKVFCSDYERLDKLVDLGVVDENLVVGTSADSAVLAGLAIRRPNGPGEYSIEAISEDMPWSLADVEAIGVYDLAEAPLSQSEAFENTVVAGIPTSVTYDRPYGSQEALMAIQAQAENPGIGSFVNILMAWNIAFGDGWVPAEMIGNLEDVVDCVQQTADSVSFAAISTSIQSMWVEFAETVISEGVLVDPVLLETRIPKVVGTGDDAIKVGDAIWEAGLTGVGSLSRTGTLYTKAIAKLRELAIYTAGSTRNALPMAERIRAISFSKLEREFAWKWLTAMNGRLKGVERKYRGEISQDSNAILRRRIQAEKREATEAFMDMAVDSVEKAPVDNHRAILAMYAWITTPRDGFPHGDIDRLIVQPSSPQHISMLQLFIEAVAMEGMLEDI